MQKKGLDPMIKVMANTLVFVFAFAIFSFVFRCVQGPPTSFEGLEHEFALSANALTMPIGIGLFQIVALIICIAAMLFVITQEIEKSAY